MFSTLKFIFIRLFPRLSDHNCLKCHLCASNGPNISLGLSNSIWDIISIDIRFKW